MVQLAFPTETTRDILLVTGLFIGMNNDGLPPPTIPIRLDDDRISNQPNIYRENEVWHGDTNGELMYSPCSYVTTPANILYYPRAVILTRICGSISKYFGIVYGGLCLHGVVYLVNAQTGRQYILWNENFVYTVSLMRASVSTGVFSMVYDFRVYDASTFSTSHVKWTISGYPILYDLPWGVAPSVETFTKIFTTYPMNKWTNLGPLGGYGYAGGLFSPSQAKVIISHAVTQVEAGISIPEPVHFGDLAQEASARVNRNNINMIAFLKDIRNPKTMIPKLKNLSNLKTWSNNYLTVKYGVLPTISDLEHIWDAVKRAGPYIDKNGFSTYSAGRTTLVPGVCRVFETDIPVISGCEQHLKLALSNEDDGFQRIVEGLDNIGMLPTFENLWDIIPYSFVLDWFIDIGGFLERIDTHLRLERQNVRYVTMSQKESRVISFPLGSMPYVFGELTRVYYHRWTSSQCPLPPLTLQQEPTPSDHWLEGGALIFQRIK